MIKTMVTSTVATAEQRTALVIGTARGLARESVRTQLAEPCACGAGIGSLRQRLDMLARL